MTVAVVENKMSLLHLLVPFMYHNMQLTCLSCCYQLPYQPKANYIRIRSLAP